MIANPEAFGTPITTRHCRNNAANKANVAKLLNPIGFEAMDVEPSDYSEQIEGMLILWNRSGPNNTGAPQTGVQSFRQVHVHFPCKLHTGH